MSPRRDDRAPRPAPSAEATRTLLHLWWLADGERARLTEAPWRTRASWAGPGEGRLPEARDDEHARAEGTKPLPVKRGARG